MYEMLPKAKAHQEMGDKEIPALLKIEWVLEETSLIFRGAKIRQSFFLLKIKLSSDFGLSHLCCAINVGLLNFFPTLAFYYLDEICFWTSL